MKQSLACTTCVVKTYSFYHILVLNCYAYGEIFPCYFNWQIINSICWVVPVVEVKNYDKLHVFDSHLSIVQILRVCKLQNIFMGSSPCKSSKSGERPP